MVFLLRSFVVGLLLAFWSRVAAAQTSKEGEERKAKPSTATFFGRSQDGWLEVTNALESLFQHGISMQQTDAKGWRTNGLQPAKMN